MVEIMHSIIFTLNSYWNHFFLYLHRFKTFSFTVTFGHDVNSMPFQVILKPIAGDQKAHFLFTCNGYEKVGQSL